MKKQNYDLEERLLKYSVRIIKIFIYKLRISLKELRETQQWLKLIQRVPLIKKPELLDDILQEPEELIKIFVTSIKTAEKKPRLGVVGCSVLGVCSYIRCWTFDVRCSTFIFQNNLGGCPTIHAYKRLAM